ncbi:MAG TPA: hypothetical protein VFJ76_04230 [Solirubrobacterales bacterium]|nr:hypothetical protein [Solirubrobacterales bacterium]
MEKPPSNNPSRFPSSLEELKRLPQRVRLTAAAAVLLAVVLVVWLIASSGGDSSSSSAPAAGAQSAGKTVSVVPESGLLGAMEGVGYPVYWAGPRAGVEYEVSRLDEGRTYVRYLPQGEEVESKKPFLTVGSYDEQDALANLRKLAQTPGAILVDISGNGSAYAESPKATSAYMAFPGVDVQVEVYDPQGGEALELIRSGAIIPIG